MKYIVYIVDNIYMYNMNTGTSEIVRNLIYL